MLHFKKRSSYSTESTDLCSLRSVYIKFTETTKEGSISVPYIQDNCLKAIFDWCTVRTECSVFPACYPSCNSTIQLYSLTRMLLGAHMILAEEKISFPDVIRKPFGNVDMILT